MNRRTWMGVVALMALAVSNNHAQAQLGNLFRRGPSIEEISTSELASMLNEQSKAARDARATGQPPKPSDFVLVDVHTESEVKVSVIPGAITKSQYERDKEKYQGRTLSKDVS